MSFLAVNVLKDFLLSINCLSPWSRVLLEQLVALNIVKKLVTFN